uniref:Uncharacterized protein 12 n=1 Tax=Halisarca dujardinii TaxID=2583056 RepID=A0AA96MMD2_HALDU|nr:uncharacterized protein 12 [Halisarca dujardinii]
MVGLFGQLCFLAMLATGLSKCNKTSPPYIDTGDLATIYPIGRVCTSGYDQRWLTLVFDYCKSHYGPTVVLAGPRPVYQHWVKVFNGKLTAKSQFHLVSFPFLDYALKVSDTTPFGATGNTKVITAAKLPAGFYHSTNGGPFRQLTDDFLFTDMVAYTDGTISGTWNHVQHVSTGLYLKALLDHPAQCGTKYDPVVCSGVKTYDDMTSKTCSCIVEWPLWRYHD